MIILSIIQVFSGIGAAMKTDKRITRTEQAIRSAFSQLITQKDINDITIKELCNVANINKSTFYLHYHDIYDLGKHFDESIISEVTAIFHEYNYAELISKSAEIARRVLSLFDGKAPLYFAYSNSPTLAYLLNNADKYIIDVLFERLLKEQPALTKEELAAHKLNITFIVNGYIGLIRRYQMTEISDEGLQFLSQSLEHGFLYPSDIASK